MANADKKAAKWADAKKKARLSVEEVAMAKELGLSPQTVIANNSSTRSEKWKAPTKEWIRDLYDQRVDRARSRAAAKRRLRPCARRRLRPKTLYRNGVPSKTDLFQNGKAIAMHRLACRRIPA